MSGALEGAQKNPKVGRRTSSVMLIFTVFIITATDQLL